MYYSGTENQLQSKRVTGKKVIHRQILTIVNKCIVAQGLSISNRQFWTYQYLQENYPCQKLSNIYRADFSRQLTINWTCVWNTIVFHLSPLYLWAYQTFIIWLMTTRATKNASYSSQQIYFPRLDRNIKTWNTFIWNNQNLMYYFSSPRKNPFCQKMFFCHV